MARKSKRQSSIDFAVWLPRREAAQILQVSRQTILNWQGSRFRVMSQTNPRGQKVWFVHREDVERERLRRLGPTTHELEVFVLSALAEAKSASEIVRSGHGVTLADVERIREHEARLSGACVLDATTMRELRGVLGIDSVDGRTLLERVREIAERASVFAARLRGGKDRYA
jgi:hypothetical protein